MESQVWDYIVNMSLKKNLRLKIINHNLEITNLRVLTFYLSPTWHRAQSVSCLSPLVFWHFFAFMAVDSLVSLKLSLNGIDPGYFNVNSWKSSTLFSYQAAYTAVKCRKQLI